MNGVLALAWMFGGMCFGAAVGPSLGLLIFDPDNAGAGIIVIWVIAFLTAFPVGDGLSKLPRELRAGGSLTDTRLVRRLKGMAMNGLVGGVSLVVMALLTSATLLTVFPSDQSSMR